MRVLPALPLVAARTGTLSLQTGTLSLQTGAPPLVPTGGGAGRGGSGHTPALARSLAPLLARLLTRSTSIYCLATTSRAPWTM